MSFVSQQTKAVAALATKQYDVAFEHLKNALEVFHCDSYSIGELAKLAPKMDSPMVVQHTLDCMNRMLLQSGGVSNVYDMWPLVSRLHALLIRGLMRSGRIKTPSQFSTWTSGSAPNLLLAICIWKRPTLSKLVLKYYAELRKSLLGEIDLTVLVCGSEGLNSERLARDLGLEYVESPNFPLALKWHNLIQASEKYNFDGLVVSGSDDLLSRKVFERYRTVLQDGVLFYGFRDGYFLDLLGENLIKFRGYGGPRTLGGMPERLGESLGMGRLFARELLEHVSFNLWPDLNLSRGLDRAVTNHMRNLMFLKVDMNDVYGLRNNKDTKIVGHISELQDESESVLLDIKVEGSVTAFSKYTRYLGGMERIIDPNAFLAKHFPAEVVVELDFLKKSYH